MIFGAVGMPAPGSLADQWFEALRDVAIRHPDPASNVVVTLRVRPGAPELEIAIANVLDTRDPARRIPVLRVSTVRLDIFPGTALARAWLAAAWAGYMTHEALELVSVDDDITKRVIDPHRCFPFGDPYATETWHDRGVRAGLPPILTRETLFETFTVIMSRRAAHALIADMGRGA